MDLRAAADGRVAAIACRAVGHAAMLLGAGRETVDSGIDPAVGLVLHKKVGDLVKEGEPLHDPARERSGAPARSARPARKPVRIAPEAGRPGR